MKKVRNSLTWFSHSSGVILARIKVTNASGVARCPTTAGKVQVKSIKTACFKSIENKPASNRDINFCLIHKVTLYHKSQIHKKKLYQKKKHLPIKVNQEKHIEQRLQPSRLTNQGAYDPSHPNEAHPETCVWLGEVGSAPPTHPVTVAFS